MNVEGLVAGLGLDPRLAVFLAGLLPLVEPRYAVLVGVGLGLPLWESASIALAAVAALAAGLTLLIGVLDALLSRLAEGQGPLGALGRAYLRLRGAAAARARGSVERWGLLGLIAFVAAPLPATGMYTGSLAALVLGIRGARLAAALAAGGAISVALVALGAAAGSLG